MFSQKLSFSHHYKSAFVGLFLLYPQTAVHAEPVTTAIAGTSAVVSALSSILDTTGELSQTLQAFNELYSEMDLNGEVSEEGQKFIQEVQDMESIARDVGYTQDQTEDLLKTDREGAKKLFLVLRKMTQAIRTAKSATKLVQRITTKAQIAQIEASETEKEILKVQYKILLEARRQSLSEKKEKLKEALERKNYLDQKEKEIKSRGGLGFGKIGIYTFPKLSSNFKDAIHFSKVLQKKLIFLILPIFMAGVGFNILKLSGADQTWKLIQNVFLCFFWFMIAPLLVEWILEVSQAFAQEFLKEELARGASSNPPDATGYMGIYNWCSWIYSNIKIFVFEVTDFAFSIVLSILIIAFPMVIFMMKIVGNGRDFFPFLAGFIALSLWPLFWNFTGLFAYKMWHSDGLLSSAGLSSVACALFQFGSPYFSYKLLQGSGGLEAVTGAASKVGGAPGKALSIGMGMGQNERGNRTAHAVSSVATGLAKTAGYLGTQAGQRAVAASRRMRAEKQNPQSTLGSVLTQGLRGAVSNQSVAQAQNAPASANSSNAGATPRNQQSIKTSAGRVLQGFKPARRIRPNREAKK